MALGRINVSVDDNLEHEFRLEVAKRLNFKKGSLQTAVEEALKLWIEQGRGKSSKH